MNIPMKIRQRQATGRWPTVTTLPGDRRVVDKPQPKHARRASGGLDKRRTANTKRRLASGQARFNRGRKGVIESARHGGAYGRADAQRRQAAR